MRTKKKVLLPLLTVIMAVCTSIGIGGIVPVHAETINKNTFVSHFTAVGDNGLVDYVNDISYGDFTNTNFSGGGVMVETRNTAAGGGWLINMPEVKYSTGVKYDGVVDISDNSSSDTLIEIAFPGTNSNDQVKGFKVVIEDASNPDKYITLFVWEAYGSSTAYNSGKSHVLAAASATWETSSPDNIANAAFDTDDYNNDGNTNDGVLVKVTADGIDGSYGKDSSNNNKEICWLNAGSPHGHATTSVKFSKESNYSFKVQFDNTTGVLSVNGVRVRKFTTYSSLFPSNNGGSVVQKYGSNVLDKFAANKVKLSVGVIRSNKGNTDDYTRFCIMNIDGNNLKADGSNNITYSGLDFTAPSTISKDALLSNFTAVGGDYQQYVNDVYYSNFGGADYNFSGGGVFVETRNKASELVSNTSTDSSNPMLIDFTNTKYPAGVKFNGAIDVSDNTAYDTLLEVAFPGYNDNFQARGIKVVIEDAYDSEKYIALYIWSAYANTDAYDSGKSSMLAAAAGTWETKNKNITNVNDLGYAGFDTDNYSGGYDPNSSGGSGCFVEVGNYNGNGNSEHDNKEICWLNAGTPYHHRVTSVKFSRKSDNSIKVQFDNDTGTLLVNGVRVRNFKSYSADGSHYFDGFTNNKVKVSVGVARSTRRSTDEFTRFCVMQLDGNSLKADANDNINYYNIDFLTGSESTLDDQSLIYNFTKVGQIEDVAEVHDLYYEDFTAEQFTGGGLMVETRNKAADAVDITSGAPLLNFPGNKFGLGVKLDNDVDVSDNTASDTLIEIAFPGKNNSNNCQVKGFQIVIQDATDAGKYITLFIWEAYANGNALDGTKANMLAAAAGTWEETGVDGIIYVSEAAFDTDDYNNDGVANDGRLVQVTANGIDNDTAEDGKEICWLNAGSPHGHATTSVKFSRKSDYTIRVQFDNANGVLYVNGVRIRDFKNYSTDGVHYFDGFTNDKVKVAVGVARTVKGSTDEFTRFCIMNIDGVSLQKVGQGALADKIVTDGETILPYKKIVDNTTGAIYQVVSGETYNIGEMFDMADSNKFAVGYMVDEDLHNIAELDSVTVGSENLYYDIAYAHFWTAAGAWVRLGSYSGLRFQGWLRNNNNNIDETANIVSEFGMLIAPTDYIAEHEFTVDNVSAGNLKKVAAENSEKDEDDNTYFYVTMTNIQNKNIARDFSVRSYVKVTYYDATEAYFHSSYNAADNSRNAYDVAMAAYDDPGTTDTEKTFLDNFYLSKVVEVTPQGAKNATGNASYTIDNVSYSSSGNIMYMTVSGANGLRALSWDGTAIPVGEGHVPDDTNLAMYEQDGKLQIALEVKRKVVSDQSKNIISGGNTAYSILIPQSASATETYAAAELQSIIYDAYGVTLPITSDYDENESRYISLGNTEFKNEANVSIMNYTKEQGGFRIKSYRDGVIIFADKDYALYYGIYRFLEENFGYKYYAYDCQVINSGSTQPLKYFDYEDYPDIKYRSLLSETTRYGYHIGDVDSLKMPLEDNAAYINTHLYLTGSKYNLYTRGVEPVYNERYGSLTPFQRLLDDMSVLTYFLPYNASWDVYGTGVYYGSTNGSWYVNGGNKGVANTQICFSKAYNNNGGMYDIILGKLQTLITDSPNKTIFEIGIGDNDAYCTCSACSSYGNGKSDVYLRFLNKLAGDIKTWQAANCPDREIYLMGYAYMAYTLPPTIQTAADNVIIRICPYTAYYDKAYNDSSNYNSSVTYLNNTSWKSIFNGWYAKAVHVGVWDYTADFTDFLEPFPFWKQLENNMDYFRSLGVMEIMAQNAGGDWYGNVLNPFEEMNDYVRSRMMWNTYLSCDDLMDEFIDAYYGAAATYVKNYISAINSAYGSTNYRVGKNDITSSKYTSSWVNTVKGYFNSAYSAVSGNDEITKRLDYLSLFYRYLQIKFNYSGKDKATFKSMCAELGIVYAENGVTIADL